MVAGGFEGASQSDAEVLVLETAAAEHNGPQSDGSRAAQRSRDERRIDTRVRPRQFDVTGALYGAENPTASNSTPGGRSRNRRVDVILTRLHQES